MWLVFRKVGHGHCILLYTDENTVQEALICVIPSNACLCGLREVLVHIQC